LLGQLRLELLDLAAELALDRLRRRRARFDEHLRRALKQRPLPAVEHARLQLVLLAQVGHGHLVEVVLAEDLGLLLGGEVSAFLLLHAGLLATPLLYQFSGPLRASRGNTWRGPQLDRAGRGRSRSRARWVVIKSWASGPPSSSLGASSTTHGGEVR